MDVALASLEAASPALPPKGPGLLATSASKHIGIKPPPVPNLTTRPPHLPSPTDSQSGAAGHVVTPPLSLEPRRGRQVRERLAHGRHGSGEAPACIAPTSGMAAEHTSEGYR